ncbi:MAG: signal recognition particle protein, partial [Myxococcales bacterium]|nr:signal recognition particle protein [Myxococcales bacterium]
IKAATGKPIKFLGMGESLDKLDEFRPEGLAGRILGMGDLVGLMNDFQDVVDEEQAAKDAEKMLGGGFGMDDFLQQIKTIQSMGSMRDLIDKMPLGSLFGGDLPEELLEQAADDRELVKIEAMINSMTKHERKDPELFLSEDARSSTPAHAKLTRRKTRPKKAKDPNSLEPDDFVGSRVARVARGSGRAAEEVMGLVSRFMVMRDMFGMLGDLMGGGGGGLLSKIPGLKQMKQMGAVRKLAKDPNALQALMGGGGGMPGMPAGFPGMPPGGMPGMPPGGMPDLASLLGGDLGGAKATKPKATKDKRKNDRKARRKNRKK